MSREGAAIGYAVENHERVMCPWCARDGDDPIVCSACEKLIAKFEPKKDDES